MVFLEVVAFDGTGREVFRDRREYRLIYVDENGEVTTDPTVAARVLSDTTLQPREPRHESFFLARRLGATRVEARLVYQRWNDGIVRNHLGLAREFIGRYLRQGVRVHRLLAHLDKVNPSKLSRVRSFEPIVVDEATADLPGPPPVPPAFQP